MKLDRKNVNSEIPTASMADIAFLLIIFFMVTAVFASTKGLEFKLPQDDEPLPPEEEEAVFIQVYPDATLTVDCKPMELADILDYLEPKLTRDAEKAVIIYSDSQAPYQGMISVYDVLLSAKLDEHGFKVKNISIPTQSDIQEYTLLFGLNPFEGRCQ